MFAASARSLFPSLVYSSRVDGCALLMIVDSRKWEHSLWADARNSLGGIMFGYKLVSFLVYSIVTLGAYAIGSMVLLAITPLVYLGLGLVASALLNPYVLNFFNVEKKSDERFHIIAYTIATAAVFGIVSVLGATNFLALVAPFAVFFVLDLLINQETKQGTHAKTI